MYRETRRASTNNVSTKGKSEKCGPTWVDNPLTGNIEKPAAGPLNVSLQFGKKTGS